MNKFKLALLTKILFFILVIFSCESPQKEVKPTNIIIVFADDMGYGDLSCYGHPNIQTPHLDKMAEEGIRFTSFYAAASVCTPSRAALLTGRYPIRNAPHNFGPESKNGLPLEEITIANLLKDKGYATMAIGKWHLGHQPEYLPTSRGFDDFYGLPYSNDMILPWCPWLTEEHKLFLYEGSEAVEEIGFNQDELTVNYTNKATEFIRSHKDQPFFLYLAHSMPHLPISTSEEFRGKSKGGLYGDVIETMDWSMGQILLALKETDIDDQTIVVFTSDNGPWHNLPDRMVQQGVERWHSGSTGLLRGAKGTTYEGGFRVPAIVRWPNEIPANQVTNEVATTMDLFSTLANIGGADIPQEKQIDGQNINALFKGVDSGPFEKFFYLRGTNLQAIRKGNWKLRCTEAAGNELYDLDEDPSEKYNLAESKPELVNELYSELQKFSEETKAKLTIKQN